MIIKDIDRELSMKLGDPVTDNGDGKIFDAVDRLSYIKDAYRRISRLIELVMRKWQPEWNSQRKLFVIFHDPTGRIGTDMKNKSEFTIPSYRKVDDVFVSYNVGAKTYQGKATYQEPTNFMNILHSLNSITAPSAEGGVFYYGLIAGKIQLAPQASGNNFYHSVQMLYLPDVEALTFEDDIPMTQQYLDLMVMQAAYFGMADIGRMDKAQAFNNDVMNNIKVMGAYAALMKQETGINA